MEGAEANGGERRTKRALAVEAAGGAGRRWEGGGGRQSRTHFANSLARCFSGLHFTSQPESTSAFKDVPPTSPRNATETGL